MIFVQTTVIGTALIEPERMTDERGHFVRTYDAEAFAQHGLNPAISQCSVSFNLRAGTLRGMHFQADPYGEDKLVRCTAGAIYDVALDLRRDSPSYLSWYGVELSAENGHALYIPAGCAHGFQTLADDSEILYQISVPFQAGSGRGVRWDDPSFAITWPAAPSDGRTMSERDANYPDHTP